MAKKYQPSGYQIIDLGTHDLSNAVTITASDNKDVLLLIENLQKESPKPILFTIKNSDDGNSIISGFPHQYGHVYSLTTNSGTLEISVDTIDMECSIVLQ